LVREWRVLSPQAAVSPLILRIVVLVKYEPFCVFFPPALPPYVFLFFFEAEPYVFSIFSMARGFDVLFSPRKVAGDAFVPLFSITYRLHHHALFSGWDDSSSLSPPIITAPDRHSLG